MKAIPVCAKGCGLRHYNFFTCEKAAADEQRRLKARVMPEFRDRTGEPGDRMRTVTRVAENVFVRKGD